MNPTNYTDLRIPGTYAQSYGGHRVFVPEPLPPKEFQLSPQILVKLEQAAYSLGQVQMCERLLPNSDLLTYGSLQLESIASSTIENTFTTPDELVRYQLSSQEPATQGTKEVANYSEALAWGCSELNSRSIITINLILGLHERLLKGVRGNVAVGKFKNRQNFIGGTVEKPVFTPSSPEIVLNLMSDYERYVNDQDSSESKIIKCAYSHYQFETIHPFTDGNGRIGRVLIVLQMMQLGLVSGPLIYPSVYFEKTRSEYYERLQGVRDSGKWAEWVEYFVDGMIFSSNKTIQMAQTILTLQSDLRLQIGSSRTKPSLRITLDSFFSYPVRTVRQISDHTGLSLNSVASALVDLCGIGMISEISENKDRKRGKVYACNPILRAIFLAND